MEVLADNVEEGKSVTAFKSVRFLMLVGMAFLFACSNVPTRIHEPGVVIESASSEVARLRSVGFWTDRDGLTLRGDVLPALFGQTLPGGHVDIAIIVPDRSSTVCTLAPIYQENQHADSDFSHAFVALPPRGSRVRVAYHATDINHDGCSN